MFSVDNEKNIALLQKKELKNFFSDKEKSKFFKITFIFLIQNVK